MSVWGDAQVFRNRIESGWLGLGGVILHDVAGSRKSHDHSYLRFSRISPDGGIFQFITAGFNAGWVNKRINSANLKFPDQFDGKFFDYKCPVPLYILTTQYQLF